MKLPYNCYHWLQGLGYCLMPLSTLFQLFTSWRSVLLVKETGVSGEYHWPAASHWQPLLHNVASSIPPHEWDSNIKVPWNKVEENKLYQIDKNMMNLYTSLFFVIKIHARQWQFNKTCHIISRQKQSYINQNGPNYTLISLL